MKAEKPLIFISNDDGFESKGIRELIKFLRPLGDLVVVAPKEPRSGASCSITSSEPVRLNLMEEEEGLRVYNCTGTPVDCIKLGLEQAVPCLPDLVIAGINHGDNSSVNAHYSGTIGIVAEGCMKGIPSIGYSICSFDEDADFSGCETYIRNITQEVLNNDLPTGCFLNVNFPMPDKLPYEGVRVCRQTKGHWEQEWNESKNPRGQQFFWLTGKFCNDEPYSTDTDQWALDNGYVAITPMQIDITAYSLMTQMLDWNFKKD